MIISIGIASALLWLLLMLISRGIPFEVCVRLASLFPARVQPFLIKMQHGFYYDVRNETMPVEVFFLLFSFIFLLYFLVIVHVSKGTTQTNHFFLIFFFAVLFRLALIPSILIHENDIYRYLWDGKVLLAGVNPYKYAPQEAQIMPEESENPVRERSSLTPLEIGYRRCPLFLTGLTVCANGGFSAKGGSASGRIPPLASIVDDHRLTTLERESLLTGLKSVAFSNGVKRQEFMKLKALRDEDHVSYQRIGHKEVPTIYPPAAQMLFALANVLKRGSIPLMKLLIVFFDVLVMVMIYRLLLYFKMNPNMVIVYAWSPLVLKEFANSGHYDAAALFFLLASLLFLFRNKLSFSRIALAFGILLKFFPIVVLPLLIRRLKVKSMLIIGAIAGAAYLPFFLWGKIEPLQVFRGLIVYSKAWFINGAFFECFYSLLNTVNVSLPLDPAIIVKIILAAMYIGIIMFLIRKRDTTDIALLKKVFWAIAWLFLLSPVGDPWYFCWVIPFLCFFPYWSFIALSWLLILSYLSFSRTVGDFTFGKFSFSYLILLQYVPFYVFFLKETVFCRNKGMARVS